MSTLWVIVIVAAVIVVFAVVMMRRRAGGLGEVRDRAEVGAGEAAPLEREGRAVEAPETARTAEKVTAAEPRQARAPGPGGESGEERRKPPEGARAGTGTETAEAVEEKKPEAEKPRAPTAEELRERVESQLGDAERMLGQLRGVVKETEGEAPVDASMLAILEEGLEEVRSLVKKKRLDQARDKGEALHAQLALFLQSARREQSS